MRNRCFWKLCIRRGAVADLHTVTDPPYYVYRRNQVDQLPINVAREVAESPHKYPRSLVFVAAEKCLAQTEEALIAVKDVANEEGWFERELEV